ncbi:hypothetical protein D1641_16665, partial [Colidextribacter sp. OB.20]|uniref:hypothetical protein n=1 Tax=Colidextribacter sp. OB.20 TaxID=2304568 RepID=UPI0013716E5F
DGDDPTQIVLVEYDADGKLDNITTGRLSDMKNGLETTKNKETQKDSEGNTVTIETWAVVVKAKGSTGKDATTARVVYIVNRPVEFFYKDAAGKTQMGYYDYSKVVEDDEFAVTVDAPKLGAGEVINEIIIRDADGKIIDRITKNIPEIVGGKISLIVPEDAAEVEFVTGEYVPPVDETKAAITVNFDAGVESVEIDGKTYSTSGSKVQVTKGEATDMTINLKKNFEIKDVAGATLKAENVYTINVSEDGAVTITTIDASMKTLTLSTVAELIHANTKVMYKTESGWVYADKTEVLDPAGNKYTYQIPAGAEVVVQGNSGNYADGTFNVDGVLVTGNDTKDQLSFTMPKANFELNKITDGSLLTAFTAGEGVTLTWTKQDESALESAPASKENADGTTTWYVVASNDGTGAAYRWKANVPVIQVADTDTVTAATTVGANTAAGANTNTPVILAAGTINLTNAGVQYKETAAVKKDTAADVFYAVGTELKVVAENSSGNKFDGVVDVTTDGTITGENVETLTVAAGTQKLAGAYTVAYSDEITCETVASDALVVKGSQIAVTIKADAGYDATEIENGKVGVFNDDGKHYADALEADLTQITVNSKLDLVVGVEITVGENGKLEQWNKEIGKTVEIKAGAANAKAYVAAGETVQATGTASTNVPTVQSNGEDVEGINGTTNKVDQTVQFVVTKRAMTIVFAT